MSLPKPIIPDPSKVKSENATLSDRILSLCQACPQGLSDKLLQTAMADVDNNARAAAINALLQSGTIDLLKSSEKGLLYRVRAKAGQEDAAGGGGTKNIKGDAEEKLVYKIIEEAGNKGTWIRDIRIKSNLVQTQLNKVLKSLKSKKLIKDVKCVNSTRKIVYMLHDLQPDRSVTGGAWYSNQEFESEFVDILNQQCYLFLHQRKEKALELAATAGPIAVRNKSMAKSEEVLAFIQELGISKVQLKSDEIESILDTLTYDGKVEKTVSVSDGSKLYRAVESLLPTTGLMRLPCGGCPVIKDCGDVGAVNPKACSYIAEWMS